MEKLPTLLSTPNFGLHFVIEINASGLGIREILMQRGRPIHVIR